MKRILFVDDEPSILDGLRDLLRRRRKEWHMVFALSGEAALLELRAAPYDILVSDMRMPGMDGLALLQRVQKEFPSVVRMVLSGHADTEASMRAIPLVHQYLSKPIDAGSFQNVLERACHLQDLLGDEKLRMAIGQAGVLPSQPQVHAVLTQALADPDVSAAKIARIIEQDIAMSAEILRLTNSAYFGQARRMSDLQSAVSYLGVSMIKHLVLGIEVFQSFKVSPALPRFSLGAVQRHSLLTGRIASRMLPDRQRSEQAFVAGVLHDIGELILATRCADAFAQSLSVAQAQKRPLHEVERELHGFTHGEAGAYLLGLWGFPYDVVEAVAHHHTPAKIAQGSLNVLSALYIADILAKEAAPGLALSFSAAPDQAYLEALGVAGELPRWREMVATLIAEA
jgi:HD-like signal output (HDOD) protein